MREKYYQCSECPSCCIVKVNVDIIPSTCLCGVKKIQIEWTECVDEVKISYRGD